MSKSNLADKFKKDFKRKRDFGLDNIDNFHKKVLKETGKSIEYIDVNKLVAAPEDWNFFPEISDSKMVEMMFSIMENGLFHPIIIWEQDNNEYMILSGHNRTKAYRNILEQYRGSDGFNEEDFTHIPSVVYKKDEINEFKAKEIIIDSNYIQRENINSLMPRIVKERMDIVVNRKDFKGNTIGKVAEELGLSQTKAHEDYSIATRLNSKVRDEYFKGRFKKKPVLNFLRLNRDTQDWIVDNYFEILTNDMLRRFDKIDTKEIIELKINDSLNSEDNISVTVRIPKSKKDSFYALVEEWKEKENIRV